jgi:predicted nucleic acid-binding protein
VIVFVDTSALIALLDEDDRDHRQAAAEFRWLAATAQLMTHNYVQLETVALARRRLGTEAVQQLTDSIFPIMRTIWVDEATHASALAVHRLGGGPSLVDQVSFLVMRQEGITLAFAFDADFQAEGFARPIIPDVGGPQRVSEQAAPYGEAVPDLVSVSEISARAGRSINTVQSWRRRHADFPAPVARLGAGPIWNWPSVAEWIAGRERQPSVARA